MMKQQFIFIVVCCVSILLLSCEKQQKVLVNPSWDYDNIVAFGKFGIHEYTFCSIMPMHQTQQYKLGTWTFYSPQKIKIAEGTFDNKLVEIDDHGGCTYWVNQTTLDPKKWKFWDSNGNPIPLNKRDPDFIKNFEFNKQQKYLYN